MAILRNITRVLRPVLGLAARLAARRDGAATLEFAIVGPAFLALLLAILYLSVAFLAQQMLESAAQNAGRLLLIGSAQTIKFANGNIGMTSADFKNAICNGISGTDANGTQITIPPMLPPMLSCSRLTVNVSTATTYNIASTASPTFTYDNNGILTSTGTGYNYQSNGSGQNNIIIVQLIYLLPTGVAPLSFSLINQPNANRMLTATSVFTTENYSCNASQTSC